jgi:predicted RNA binding protein YcfA (HicA-like mRNA interferase family)
MNLRKLLQKAISSPANLRFRDLVALVEGFGFQLSRTSGSHHIFIHPGVREQSTFRMSAAKRNRIRFDRCSSWSSGIIFS